MKYFYCYSYKLMRFLKFMDERYAFAGKHPNGNTFWAFPASPELNKKLTQWKAFKDNVNEV